MLIDSPVSPPKLAKLTGRKPDTVRGWIMSGALEAIDVSAAGATRSRWIITPEAWERFCATRSSRRKSDETKPTPRKRKPRREVIQFF